MMLVVYGLGGMAYRLSALDVTAVKSLMYVHQVRDIPYLTGTVPHRCCNLASSSNGRTQHGLLPVLHFSMAFGKAGQCIHSGGASAPETKPITNLAGLEGST